MSSLTGRAIAALIYPHSYSPHDSRQLVSIAGLIDDHARPQKPSPKKGAVPRAGSLVIVAEGPTKLLNTEIPIFRFTMQDVEELIVATEVPQSKRGVGKRKKFANDLNVEMIVIVGSVEYCQAFAHYLATLGNGTGENWGFHFIRKLSNKHARDIVFMTWDDDLKQPRFGSAHLDTLSKKKTPAHVR
jgi:hypothetical protein